MTNFDERPSVRLPERVKELLAAASNEPTVTKCDAMEYAILEELDRLHAIVRKHNLS